MVDLIVDPGGQGHHIDELWAYIGGPEDNEGVLAVTTPGGMMLPLVGADIQRIESLRRYAVNVARSGVQPVRLMRFTVREVVEEL